MYTKLAKDVFYTFSATIANTAIGFVSSILIAHLLGPETQGVLKVVLLLPSLLYTFLNLGVESSILYFGSGEKNYRSINRLTVRIVLLFLLAATAAGAAAIAVGSTVFDYYKGIPVSALASVLLLAPLNFYLSMQTVLIRAENRFKRYNLISIARQLVYVAVALCVLMIKSLWVVIAANYVSVIVGILLCKAGMHHRNLGQSRPYMRKFMKFGLKSYVSNIINFFNYRFDLMYMTPLVSKKEIGIYSVAQSLSELIWAIPNSVALVLLPRIVNMSLEAKRVVYLRLCRHISTVMVGVVVLGYLTAGFLVPLVYSKDYIGSIFPFKLLLVGTFFMTYSKILGNAVSAFGVPEKNIYSNAAGSLTNIAINIVLIPQYGIIGAAVAGSISYSVSGFVSIIVFMRMNPGCVRLRDMLIVNRKDVSAIARMAWRKLQKKPAA
jgi:O-antigen/teichoic acid export membrane protein